VTIDTETKESEGTLRYIMRGYDGPRDIQSQRALATMLSDSDMLGDRYHRKPANIVRMMWKAMAMDIPLDTTLEQVGEYKGKTCVTNALMLALMRRGGLTVDVQKRDETGTLLLITRPGHKPEQVGYTMEDAEKAGLVDDKNVRTGGTIKSQYKLRPKTMLFWRAVAEASRMCGSDITNGLSLYTREELEAIPDEEVIAQAVDTPGAARLDINTILGEAVTAQSKFDKAMWEDAWRKAAAAGLMDLAADLKDPESLKVGEELTIIGKNIVESLKELEEFGFNHLHTGSDSELWNTAITGCTTLQQIDLLKLYSKACDMGDRYKAAIGKQREQLASAGMVPEADTVGA